MTMDNAKRGQAEPVGLPQLMPRRKKTSGRFWAIVFLLTALLVLAYFATLHTTLFQRYDIPLEPQTLRATITNNGLVEIPVQFGSKAVDCEVDTGCEETLWESRQELGSEEWNGSVTSNDPLQSVRNESEYVVPSMKLGSFECRSFPTICFTAEHTVAHSLPPLIGSDIWSHGVLDIDYEHKQITLSRIAMREVAAGERAATFNLIDSSLPGGVCPYVNAKINGKSVNAELDTGISQNVVMSDQAVLSTAYGKSYAKAIADSFAASSRAANGMDSERVIKSPVGFQIDALPGSQIKHLILNVYPWENSGFSEKFIGVSPPTLGATRVIFDYPNHLVTMYFKCRPSVNTIKVNHYWTDGSVARKVNGSSTRPKVEQPSHNAEQLKV